jgi:hypothetical protein
MNGTIVAAIIESVQTRRDNTIKIVLGCQELSPSKGAELLGMMNKLTAVYLSPKETISESELKQVDAVDVELNGKTPSQRLRNVLFIMWQQKPDGYKDFDGFYKAKMELIIEHYKSKLDP